ncbi:preprotein translocase subunit SecG [Caloranaerobacter sp. TR13]|uniref:preprotein translocase subunit SecG n=1 Tax=Caloranaerobacter sp. TR13 TaxID=1302151 RepID=UPI0006D3ABEE|nr:preprotein translocase subunit SecG [Caloranaerobacter sp. TR13]KPU26474.1 preprotein translocase subunit SecG [Caloranaerobacter sp. TR13]
MKILFTILILVSSLVLIASILLQSGKNAGLSGTIAGGAESIWGKNKSRTYEGILSKITSISAIVFVLSALVLAALQ